MQGAFTAVICSMVMATSPPPNGKAVATLPVHVEGQLGSEWKRALDEGIADGLARGSFRVVATDSTCTERSCFVELAAEVEASYLLRTVVTAEDRNYAVAITLIDGVTGEVTAEASGGCEVCGMQEVRTIVADQAAGLRKKIDALGAGPPLVAIETVPEGAVARIDGEPVGVTPVRYETTEGEHLARVEKDGYVAVERQFIAVAGVDETLKFELEPLPDLRKRYRPWGWIALGAGVGSLAAGATFLALDERPAPGDRCAGNNVDAAGNCRFRYNTLTPGLVLTTAGALLLAGGVIVAIATRPRRRTERRTAWSPAGLGVRARF